MFASDFLWLFCINCFLSQTHCGRRGAAGPGSDSGLPAGRCRTAGAGAGGGAGWCQKGPEVSRTQTWARINQPLMPHSEVTEESILRKYKSTQPQVTVKTNYQSLPLWASVPVGRVQRVLGSPAANSQCGLMGAVRALWIIIQSYGQSYGAQSPPLFWLARLFEGVRRSPSCGSERAVNKLLEDTAGNSTCYDGRKFVKSVVLVSGGYAALWPWILKVILCKSTVTICLID